jgi:hypothetical protein
MTLKNYNVVPSGSRGGSVDVTKVYGMNGRSSIPFVENRFSIVHSVQTDYGTHPASYAVVKGTLSPGVKRPVREANHSSLSSAEVKNDGAIIALPIYIYGLMLN